MSSAISSIDHMVVMVRDLNGAAARWQRYGFKCSPRGFHDGLDTANHIAAFPSDYLELLGVRVPTEANRIYADAIEQRPGLWGIAFRGVARTAWEKLRAQGVPASEPRALTRPVQYRRSEEHTSELQSPI